MQTETTQPVDLFYRMRMMLAQMVMVVVATFIMLLLPVQQSSVAMAALYATVLVVERRLGIRSPLTLGLVILSVALALLGVLVDLDAYGIHVPAAFFAMMFAVGAACLVQGHPASLYYSGRVGAPALHWKTSASWVLIYLAALVVSLLLPLRPGLFWLLPVLTLGGAAWTLWLQLGTAGQRPRAFSMGGFRFEELPPRHDALAPFYAHFVREAMHSLKQGREARGLSFDELVALKMAADAPSWPGVRFFAAYEGADIIGTISCMVKAGGALVGMESGVSDPVSLEPLRRYGRVMEVGRFSIAARHRFRPEVFRGLLRCVVETAFEHDAAFLVAQAYPSVVGIYSKIGFHKISEQVVRQSGTGAPVLLMVFNLAKKAVCDPELATDGRAADAPAALRLSERYFKRQSLRAMFSARPAWALGEAALARLCGNGRMEGGLHDAT